MTTPLTTNENELARRDRDDDDSPLPNRNEACLETRKRGNEIGVESSNSKRPSASKSDKPLKGKEGSDDDESLGGNESTQKKPHYVYRDFSSVRPAAGSSNATKQQQTSSQQQHHQSIRNQKLPAKLNAMLSTPEFEGIIGWMPHGRSWKVHNPTSFVRQVIPLYFEYTNYNSFIRLVNAWGFRRITKGPDRNSYYHELFLRGMPHLHAKMHRMTVNEKKIPLDPEDEPDLYRISQLCPLPSPSPPLPQASKSPRLMNAAASAMSTGSAAGLTQPRGAVPSVANNATTPWNNSMVQNLLQQSRSSNSHNNNSSSSSSIGQQQQQQQKQLQLLNSLARVQSSATNPLNLLGGTAAVAAARGDDGLEQFLHSGAAAQHQPSNLPKGATNPLAGSLVLPDVIKNPAGSFQELPSQQQERPTELNEQLKMREQQLQRQMDILKNLQKKQEEILQRQRRQLQQHTMGAADTASPFSGSATEIEVRAQEGNEEVRIPAGSIQNLDQEEIKQRQMEMLRNFQKKQQEALLQKQLTAAGSVETTFSSSAKMGDQGNEGILQHQDRYTTGMNATASQALALQRHLLGATTTTTPASLRQQTMDLLRSSNEGQTTGQQSALGSAAFINRSTLEESIRRRQQQQMLRTGGQDAAALLRQVLAMDRGVGGSQPIGIFGNAAGTSTPLFSQGRGGHTRQREQQNPDSNLANLLLSQHRLQQQQHDGADPDNDEKENRI